MASGSITSWEIDGEAVETVTDFIFGGSKITADGDCSREIKKKKNLLLGRKVMTNLDSIFKSTIQFFCTQPSLWSTLTSVHDYWKNHSLDYKELCQQSNVSAF